MTLNILALGCLLVHFILFYFISFEAVGRGGARYMVTYCYGRKSWILCLRVGFLWFRWIISCRVIHFFFKVASTAGILRADCTWRSARNKRLSIDYFGGFQFLILPRKSLPYLVGNLNQTVRSLQSFHLPMEEIQVFSTISPWWKK